MTISQARSQTAASQLEREFAQWFRWASFSVANSTDQPELNQRLEVLSRLAVWVVFDWMLHNSDASLQRVNLCALSPTVQQLGSNHLFEAELKSVPLELFWSSAQSTHRGLWDILSSYSFTFDEQGRDDTFISPKIFSSILNCLLSTQTGFGALSLRKRNGCFDTPDSVVAEMVLDALHTYLDARISTCNLRAVLLAGLPLKALSLESRHELVCAIAHLKVIDPACGAGVFPLRVAYELDRLLMQLDPHNELLLSVSNAASVAPGLKAPAALWRRWFVLTRCIYSIDVQPLAVDMTRMRCFFWLLSGVENRQKWMEPLLGEAFSAHIHTVAADALSTDTVTQFGITKFDVAIANPPYIDSETMVKHHAALRKQYAIEFQAAKGNWDLFVVFMEWGLRSLAPQGVLTYIVPNKLISAPYATALRQLLRHYSVTQIQDFSNVPLFRDASVYPVVVTAQRQPTHPPVTITVMQSLTRVAATRVVSAEQFYHNTDWSRHFAPEALQPLLDRCNAFPVLEDWFPAITSAMTVREAYALQPMLQDAPCDLPHKKLVNTGTIDRYQILWGDRPTQYLKRRYQAPVVCDDDLYQLNPIRLQLAAATKIMVGGMTRQLECCYDRGECLAGKSTTVILPGHFDLRYLLALLNSPLVSLWYRNTYRAMSLSGGYLRISHRELKTIPIPAPTPLQEANIVECVNQRLTSNPSQAIALEHELNTLIYQLYNLSNCDIKLIESI